MSMKVYRISKEKYIKDLSGTGAKLYGGRWNPKGYALLYTSEHRSLAALEVLVHLNRDTIPDGLKILTLEIPDQFIDDSDRKKYKKIFSSEFSTARFVEEGKKWIEAATGLALRVPSVLIHEENNILVNPLHKAFKKLKIVSVEDFGFDERFFM